MYDRPGEQETEDVEVSGETQELPGEELAMTDDKREALLKEVQERFPYITKEKLSAIMDHPNFQTFRKGLQSDAGKLMEQYMPEVAKLQPRATRRLSPLQDASKGPQHALWRACQMGATDEDIFECVCLGAANVWRNTGFISSKSCKCNFLCVEIGMHVRNL
jgi:hypothetical protein